MEVDGSGLAMGVVLMQNQQDQWKTVAYHSKTFQEAERNYAVEDRELLAIVLSLKEWHQYLLGAAEFKIWTDHKNLQSFKSPQWINRRQARWISDVLSHFHYTLHHLPGIKNIHANALSHQYSDNSQQDNTNVTVLPPELFHEILILDNDIEKRIAQA